MAKKEEQTIHDLELRARGVKLEMDRLEIAHHGMTFDELIRLLAPGAPKREIPAQLGGGEKE